VTFRVGKRVSLDYLNAPYQNNLTSVSLIIMKKHCFLYFRPMKKYGKTVKGIIVGIVSFAKYHPSKHDLIQKKDMLEHSSLHGLSAIKI
jgi:hypothetical protein